VSLCVVTAFRTDGWSQELSLLLLARLVGACRVHHLRVHVCVLIGKADGHMPDEAPPLLEYVTDLVLMFAKLLLLLLLAMLGRCKQGDLPSAFRRCF